MDLKEEIKKYEVTITELLFEFEQGSKRTFESVKKRESLAGQLEALKIEVADLMGRRKI